MVLTRITKRLIKHKLRSCGGKNKYSYLHSLWRWFTLKFKNVDVQSYKCLYGNHYHIGHSGVWQKKILRYAKKRARMSLLYQGEK